MYVGPHSGLVAQLKPLSSSQIQHVTVLLDRNGSQSGRPFVSCWGSGGEAHQERQCGNAVGEGRGKGHRGPPSVDWYRWEWFGRWHCDAGPMACAETLVVAWGICLMKQPH